MGVIGYVVKLSKSESFLLDTTLLCSAMPSTMLRRKVERGWPAGEREREERRAGMDAADGVEFFSCVQLANMLLSYSPHPREQHSGRRRLSA